MTDNLKQTQTVLDWYIKPNYELRLFNKQHDYLAIDVLVKDKNDIDEIVRWSEYVLYHGDRLLAAVIFDEPLEKSYNDKPDLPTWPSQTVSIDPSCVNGFEFTSWYINHIGTEDSIAHGTADEMYYDDISDPIVGKYALHQSLLNL